MCDVLNQTFSYRFKVPGLIHEELILKGHANRDSVVYQSLYYIPRRRTRHVRGLGASGSGLDSVLPEPMGNPYGRPQSMALVFRKISSFRHEGNPRDCAGSPASEYGWFFAFQG